MRGGMWCRVFYPSAAWVTTVFGYLTPYRVEEDPERSKVPNTSLLKDLKETTFCFLSPS